MRDGEFWWMKWVFVECPNNSILLTILLSINSIVFFNSINMVRYGMISLSSYGTASLASAIWLIDFDMSQEINCIGSQRELYKMYLVAVDTDMSICHVTLVEVRDILFYLNIRCNENGIQWIRSTIFENKRKKLI